MRYLFILLTLCSLPLSARILLDEAMTKEEQKQTGVASLTYKQKLQLENWLNDHCILKTDSGASAETPEEKKVEPLTVALNIQGGKRLQLSDNTLWEIAPNDVPNASFWILPVPIKLSTSNDVNYPTLLTNLNSGISVRGREVAPTQETSPPSS